MAYANLRNDGYWQDNEHHPDAHRRDQRHDREYYADSLGGYAPPNYPQFGAAENRNPRGNDDHYGHRHEHFAPSYGPNEYRFAGPLRHAAQRAEAYDEERYRLDTPDYERHARDFRLYGPDAGTYRHGRPGFPGREDAGLGAARRGQSYPAYSSQYPGSAYPGGWDQPVHEREYGAHSAEDHRGNHARHIDPDYHQWRLEQIRNLDRDYDDWRQERYGKFSSDFNTWRSNRTVRDPLQTTTAADLMEGRHGGTASTATATAAGIKK